MYGFNATNVGKHRLTVKPPVNVGVFSKGRASAKTQIKARAKKVQETHFSESRFLNGMNKRLNRKAAESLGSDTAPRGSSDHSSCVEGVASSPSKTKITDQTCPKPDMAPRKSIISGTKNGLDDPNSDVQSVAQAQDESIIWDIERDLTPIAEPKPPTETNAQTSLSSVLPIATVVVDTRTLPFHHHCKDATPGILPSRSPEKVDATSVISLRPSESASQGGGVPRPTEPTAEASKYFRAEGRPPNPLASPKTQGLKQRVAPAQSAHETVDHCFEVARDSAPSLTDVAGFAQVYNDVWLPSATFLGAEDTAGSHFDEGTEFYDIRCRSPPFWRRDELHLALVPHSISALVDDPGPYFRSYSCLDLPDGNPQFSFHDGHQFEGYHSVLGDDAGRNQYTSHRFLDNPSNHRDFECIDAAFLEDHTMGMGDYGLPLSLSGDGLFDEVNIAIADESISDDILTPDWEHTSISGTDEEDFCDREEGFCCSPDLSIADILESEIDPDNFTLSAMFCQGRSLLLGLSMPPIYDAHRDIQDLPRAEKEVVQTLRGHWQPHKL
ncbi:hypothetical protein HGRIS_009786 [Hohenbuehelia grisea]